MKLLIVGKPSTAPSPLPIQDVLVKFDPIKNITVINCDVDVITLGIAVSVLNEQFELALKDLPIDTANRIRDTTRKAVYLSERDQSQNFKPTISQRLRANDGSNGKANTAWGEPHQYGRPRESLE